MLSSLPRERPPEEPVEKAKELYRNYIPISPDLRSEGAPMHTRRDAEEAVSYALQVLEYCRGEVLRDGV